MIVEKPFGRDLASAEALNRSASTCCARTRSIASITTSAKRRCRTSWCSAFANGIFEPLWNHKYIDNVQLTVAEAIGIEGRGNYYDQSGTLRDMVQNHIFQFMCLMAMEPPVAFEPNAVHDEKVKVLRALRELPADGASINDWTVRAQYGNGFDKAASARLSRRDRRSCRLAHRDLCRAQAVHR